MGWWKSLWYSTQGYPPKKCMVDIKDQSEFARKQTYADEATQARFIQDIYLKKSAFSYFHIRLAAKYPRPIRSCTSNMEAQLRAKTTGQLRGFGVLRCKMGDQHRLFFDMFEDVRNIGSCTVLQVTTLNFMIKPWLAWAIILEATPIQHNWEQSKNKRVYWSVVLYKAPSRGPCLWKPVASERAAILRLGMDTGWFLKPPKSRVISPPVIQHRTGKTPVFWRF